MLTLALTASLGPEPAFASKTHDPDSIRKQVERLRAGALIEVRFLNREKLRRRLGAVDPEGFVLGPRDGAGVGRQVAYAEVDSVNTIQGKGGKVAVWVVAGVLVVAVVAALAVYLKFRHNEGL